MAEEALKWSAVEEYLTPSVCSKLITSYGGLISVCVDYSSIYSCDRLEDLVVFYDFRSSGLRCVPPPPPSLGALLLPDDGDATPASEPEHKMLHLRVSHDVAHKIYTQMCSMLPKATRVEADGIVFTCKCEDWNLMPQAPSDAFQALMVAVSEYLAADPLPINALGESEQFDSDLLDYQKQLYDGAVARLRNFPFDAVKESMWAFRYAIFRLLCAHWNVLHSESITMTLSEFKAALANGTFRRSVHRDIVSRYSALQFVFGFFDKTIVNMTGHLTTSVDSVLLSKCCSELSKTMETVFRDVKAVVNALGFDTTETKFLDAAVKAYQAVDLYAEFRALLDARITAVGKPASLRDTGHTSFTLTTPIEGFQLLRSGLKTYHTAVGNADMGRIKAIYGCFIMLRMETIRAKGWSTPVQLLTRPFPIDPGIPIAILQTDDFTELSDVYHAGFRPLMASSSWASTCYYEAHAVISGKVALLDCAVLLENTILKGAAGIKEPEDGTSIGTPFPIFEVSKEEQQAHSDEYGKFMNQLAAASYGERRPVHANKAAPSMLSRLRKALGSATEAIATVAGGNASKRSR